MRTPVYDALEKYAGSSPLVFHMPGHKLGSGIPGRFACDMARLDVTEIPGMDNLHFPAGILLEAQELAAHAFRADETFFLVNGSTCGIQAMVPAVCGRGGRLVVARDCHKSVIGALVLSGSVPVYANVGFDCNAGVPSVVRPRDIEDALGRCPDCAGVLVTRPNYYGICCDLEEIAHIAHRHGKPLLVDEAHGAHLAFSSLLPVCAMDLGADICVQSAHKTLPALTQGAYLHVKRSGRIDTERLRYYLRLFQTSSPSYIIMAYLDIARAVMAEDGRRLLDRLAGGIRMFSRSLAETAGLTLLSEEMLERGTLDKTRIVVDVRKTGVTGYRFEEILRCDYGVYSEMADLFNVVFIAAVSDGPAELDRLAAALKGTAVMLAGAYGENCGRGSASEICNIRHPDIPEAAMPPSEASGRPAVRVKLSDACGRVCARALTPYPPGVPVICPGERFTRGTVEYLELVASAGGIVDGLADGKIYIVA